MVRVPLMFLSEFREFPSAPCLAGKKKRLMAARVSMLLKSRASPDMFPFSLCNKKRLAIRHMNRPLFPTTLSIPSYDNGKYVGLRAYQHPFVKLSTLSVSHQLLQSFKLRIDVFHTILAWNSNYFRKQYQVISLWMKTPSVHYSIVGVNFIILGCARS